MFNGAKAMDKASAEGDMEEDREIAGGSGEIVARAGGQIIPVIRGSPSHRLRSLIFSLSLSVSLSSLSLFLYFLLARSSQLIPKVSKRRRR